MNRAERRTRLTKAAKLLSIADGRMLELGREVEHWRQVANVRRLIALVTQLGAVLVLVLLAIVRSRVVAIVAAVLFAGALGVQLIRPKGANE